MKHIKSYENKTDKKLKKSNIKKLNKTIDQFDPMQPCNICSVKGGSDACIYCLKSLSKK